MRRGRKCSLFNLLAFKLTAGLSYECLLSSVGGLNEGLLISALYERVDRRPLRVLFGYSNTSAYIELIYVATS